MSEHNPSGAFPSEEAIPGMGGAFVPDRWFFDREDVRHHEPQSSWDTRVLEQIKQHLHSEHAVIEAYEEMRDEASGAVAYLIDLILVDEKRHHLLFMELANAVEAYGRPVASASAVPTPDASSDEQRMKLLHETRRFLQIERDDERVLKELQHELRPVRTSTIWPLLVELMALDSEKHMKILHHIEQIVSH